MTPPRAAPKRTSHGCQLGDLLQLLGRAHVMGILYVFHTEPGAHRFVDLQKKLGISPNTLSDRLKDLVAAGLLTRTAYNEIPPRVDYEITKKGSELALVFQDLTAWAKRNDLEPMPQPAQKLAA
ncbi:MAG: winged helix-turn-helix transcriptional regulator [Thermoplasmatota archaeon]